MRRENNDSTPERKPGGISRLRWILSGALLFIAVTATVLWADAAPETPEPAAPQETSAGEADSDSTAPEAIRWDPPEHITPEGGVRNLLLAGQDRRPGEERGRADTILLCSLNENTNTITFVSLLRDTYVPIPGFQDDRINAAFALGGLELLTKTVERDFGVTLDGSFAVDFDGFTRVMSAAAPLELELSAAEADYMNLTGGWSLTEGMNYLDETQLLSYVRNRSVGQADFDRSQRQRKVIIAALQKLSAFPVTELFTLAERVLPYVETDLTDAKVLELVFVAVSRHMTAGESLRLPADGTYTDRTIRGMAVLVPDLAENSRLLRQYLYGE